MMQHSWAARVLHRVALPWLIASAGEPLAGGKSAYTWQNPLSYGDPLDRPKSVLSGRYKPSGLQKRPQNLQGKDHQGSYTGPGRNLQSRRVPSDVQYGNDPGPGRNPLTRWVPLDVDWGDRQRSPDHDNVLWLPWDLQGGSRRRPGRSVDWLEGMNHDGGLGDKSWVSRSVAPGLEGAIAEVLRFFCISPLSLLPGGSTPIIHEPV